MISSHDLLAWIETNLPEVDEAGSSPGEQNPPPPPPPPRTQPTYLCASTVGTVDRITTVTLSAAPFGLMPAAPGDFAEPQPDSR